MNPMDRLLEVGQFLLRLSKERAQEAMRLNHGGNNTPETKAEIETLMKESSMLIDGYDVVAEIIKAALEQGLP